MHFSTNQNRDFLKKVINMPMRVVNEACIFNQLKSKFSQKKKKLKNPLELLTKRAFSNQRALTTIPDVIR